MNRLLLLSIFLPLHFLANTPGSEQKPVTQQPTPGTFSKEVAPGVNIHLNVANSHDVENKNSADATNAQGPKQPQVIHHIITIKREEKSFTAQMKSSLITIMSAGALSQIPFGKIGDFAKDSLSNIDPKKVINTVLRRG